ncbi:FG-GAP repeat domain-containing protein [Hymenobacter arizonensis]|uniref:Repeat domain-containing protein n=1 Tax=Hymenobacter arizonensis TaxID=1227077 RepID=A0A1I6BN31_HYMAR|nr:VCBS repeat-containing protein [Hymenobacter arizonensis]SFQ82333.1 Repeat domain-containing protein [Hymenobacter arizonensis]
MQHFLPLAPSFRAPFLRFSGLAGALLALAPVASGQTFAPAVAYNAGTNANPLSLAVADVNGDGQLDVLTANNGSSAVGVLLNTGSGTFQAVVPYSTGTGSQPYAVAVADVNADGRPDVLTANYGTNSVGVLLGTGTGTFAVAVAYATGSGSQPVGLVVADVNADGRPDVLTANASTNSVGVLLGSGTGTFAAVVPYSTGPASPTAVAVGDVNADGRPDLVVAVSGAVGVLLGTGTGTFQAMVTTTVSNSPGKLVLADVNADGRLDVVTVSDNGSGSAGVLLGSGTGAFAAAVSYATGSNTLPNGVAVADVSGDGRPDIITANPGNYTVGVLKNNGNGTFAAAQPFSAGSTIPAPYDVVAADVNGDGRPDLVTANVSTNTVSVLRNTATFLATQVPALPGAVRLYPNPAAPATAFAVTGLPAGVRRVEAALLNAMGQVVARLAAPAAQGAAHAALPTAQLAAGLYLLRLHAHDAHGTLVGALPFQRLQVR